MVLYGNNTGGNVKSNLIPFLISDLEIGTREYGFIARPKDMDPDDEDRLYQRHLRKMGVDARVVEGTVKVMCEDQTGRV